MYGPYGYFNFPTPQTVQQMQQMQQMSPQPPQDNMPVVMQVPTIKQVEQAPVQPGGRVLVMVANEPVIAMRTADNMGITSTDYYHIERFDPDSIAPVTPNEYVTRAEFQQFVDSLKMSVNSATPKEEA